MVIRIMASFFLLLFLSQAHAVHPLFMLSQSSTDLQCMYWKSCDYRADKRPITLAASTLLCVGAKKWNDCDLFVKNNPEFREHARSCSPRDICEERLQQNIGQICLESYWKANVDFYKAIKHLFTEGIDVSKLNFNPVELAEKATANLEKTGLKLACLDHEIRTEMLCYAAADIVSVGSGAKLLLKMPKLSKIGTGVAAKLGLVDRRKGSSVAYTASLSRDEIKKHLLHQEYTSEMDNAYWMIKASQPPTGGSRFFIEVENSKLKELNDTIKDKDLVTSMTNFHKQLIFEELDNLKRKYPKLNFAAYSDFKSVRVMAEGPRTPEFDRDLVSAFSSAQNKFESWVNQNHLVRQEDKPLSWFKLGVGQTADQASTAARFGRSSENPYQMTKFESPEVRQALNTNLTNVEFLRSSLSQQLKSTSLLDSSANPTMRLEVFELVRKNRNLNDLREKIQREFGIQEISDSTLINMQLYADQVDRFSPSLHIAKREIASLDEAVNGGFSIDFAGMGAHNLKATAEALARSKNLDEALTNARAGERQVTELFESRREDIRTVSAHSLGRNSLDSKCSGDDCIGAFRRPMHHEEKISLVSDLAKQSDGQNIRLAFISDGIKNKTERTQIATHGEAIEKHLRERLRGQIEPAKLKGVLFGIDMKGKEIGKGPVHLILGEANNVKLTADEFNKVKKAFRESVIDLNVEIEKKGHKGYRPE